MKQYSFVGKTEVLAAASPRTAAPECPGPIVHRGLLVSWGSGAGEQSWNLSGWQWGTQRAAQVQESQGGSPQARVSTLEGSCGLAAGRRPTAVAAV